MSSISMTESATSEALAEEKPAAERLATARRVFQGALTVNCILTLFCIVAYATGKGSAIAGTFEVNLKSIVGVLIVVTILHVVWGFIWLGIKSLLLARFVGFSKQERVLAFSSRMSQPFEVAELLARHSERRVRIADMIGRRGRFITISIAAFIYLYAYVDTERPASFATAFLSANLIDAVLASWLYIAFFHRSNLFAAALFGPQSRVMDGMLARANCLLIITLWTLFKFVLVPIGGQLAELYSPDQFAVIFALIWGSYMVTDTLAEIGGSLYGRQRIRVLGIGDINRKSVGGTLTGFVGCLLFCMTVISLNGLPVSWLALAFAVSLSNSVLELISPRGTDDFTMATANALICWGFGATL